MQAVTDCASVRQYLESLANLLLRVGVLHLSCHHGQELCRRSALKRSTSRYIGSSYRTGEVNRAVVVGVNLVDHVLELRLGGVLAE